MARRYLRDLATLRRPAGALRARCRPFEADPARACIFHDARHSADDGGGGRGAACRRLDRRAARRAVDAVERGRQLHQHAVADPDPALSLPHAGDHAWRVGRIQSVAGADGVDHAGRLRTLGRQGAAGFEPSRGAGRARGGGRAGLQRAHAHRRPPVAAPDRRQGFHQMSKANLLDRRQVVSTLLADRKDVVAVGGLGASTNDMCAAGDHVRNFYLWGGMGGAAMIGLGLALAQPKLPVLVITGDGEMLMGMGSLATIGLQKPSNLSIAVLDNEAYGETGGQASHTAAAADLVGVARACGIGDSRSVTTMAEVEAFAKAVHDVSAGPRFANVKIDSASLDRILPVRDGTYIVNRIRGDLGFQPIEAAGSASPAGVVLLVGRAGAANFH